MIMQSTYYGNTTTNKIARSNSIGDLLYDAINHFSDYFSLAITVWFPVVFCPNVTFTSEPIGK